AAAGSKDRWQDLADGAKDETEKAEYEQKAQQAGGDADQAAGVLSSAKSTVESAVSDRDRAAEHAVDQIEEITSSDDLNDGWWDNWGSKLVAAIADIADMISTIAGILAIIVAFIPVVGTALAGVLIVIAAVAAIVSAVANITLAATGERSWAEAGLAIAGAALSLIGLGAAAKAATGLAKGVSKTAVKQGLRSGKNCKLGFSTCFVAGTPVLTADGTKPIEDIRAGDKVWTRNLATGLEELQLVAETFVHQTVALHHLTINGSVVSTTAEHPFMVHGRGWQMAGNLRPGDVLITPDGTTVLEAVEVEERDLADIENVYNFHVENNHNYYVHAGDTPVLVHNTHGGSAPKVWTSTDAHVGKLANDIDAAFPGRVKKVNDYVDMTSGPNTGLKREVDIELNDGIVIQVKKDNARGLGGQIEKTKDTTGRDCIGFAPDTPKPAAIADAARKGNEIFTNTADLIARITP
ncbi:intein C-terminal splicing region/intein N-terminal splicing region, partial [Promicromonospora umidemergens]|uniref:polymorphic toxin-type HINT domain-containing protein n=2 Tax=Promicromonospora umidemergens TaxID=629679 RepID=UPI0020A457F2